uniref:Uncharacterized protein n=1 Tax=Sphaeramia orbicularis TaxID=375764 RepID=A0A673C247_9TELE
METTGKCFKIHNPIYKNVCCVMLSVLLCLQLKEVEEEILLKNGEIRVLRDSLKTAQQEKEAQRQNQALVETQRLREQSEKEKELSRKVQSLQSELQFKEAEINEMKSKLHSSDKKNSSPLARNRSHVHIT